jgi:hypothetical protein
MKEKLKSRKKEQDRYFRCVGMTRLAFNAAPHFIIHTSYFILSPPPPRSAFKIVIWDSG